MGMPNKKEGAGKKINGITDEKVGGDVRLVRRYTYCESE